MGRVDKAASMALVLFVDLSSGDLAMTKAVRVHKVGGPEALVYEPIDLPGPAAGDWVTG
jgi:hypothetical protein